MALLVGLETSKSNLKPEARTVENGWQDHECLGHLLIEQAIIRQAENSLSDTSHVTASEYVLMKEVQGSSV